MKELTEFSELGNPESIEGITAHISRYTGVDAGCFHELIPTPGKPHIDIHHAEPTKQRNFHVLFTTGMSDKPMNVDRGFAKYRYAELMLCLPGSWPASKIDPDDETYGWPVAWLKMLADVPYEHNTWFGWWHTIPNGDRPEPLATDTKLCCWFLMQPQLFPEDFQTLKVSSDKTIHFYALVPIYKQEMEYKLKHGGEGLYKRLVKSGVTELLDPKRKNVCT